MEAFEILKQNIVSTPILRHPDRERPFIIILHAILWAVSAVLGQEYGEMIYPVRFTGRVLQDQELRYYQAEKKIVGLLSVLRVFYLMLVGNARLKVYTCYLVLRWLFKYKFLEGRCEKWTARLAPWSLKVHNIQNDEDGLASILGAGITLRDKLDQIAKNLILAKGRMVSARPISLEMLKAGCAVTWDVVAAPRFEGISVNEAEYHGMVEDLKMVLDRGIRELIIVGDFRIAIQQAQGLIPCLNPGLQLPLDQFESPRKEFKSVRLVHVKREYHAAADYVTCLGIPWIFRFD
ncbi:hypothetical protein PHMEG_00033776 [Phytophthora megakarya]|uniref:Reverse transcriptase n=1 Tax=Phytophthora megakarya TaxID=4795 RepID=A0A225USB2_9STRA|nr:hypothetical protein PHMEG_00033776 [Phytophthora megakarya]